MAIAYEPMEVTLIANTTMEKGLIDGVHKIYRITPNEGYEMHDTPYDHTVIKDGVKSKLLGYRTTTASVSANYDFTPADMLDENGNTVSSHGTRQLFCKLKTEVLEN